MRISEIQNQVKPIKPLTPAQARIKSFNDKIANAKQQLQTEKDRQKKQRENERLVKQSQQLSKLKM